MIRVGVGITFLVKLKKVHNQLANIWIYSVDDYLKENDKSKILSNAGDLFNLPIIRINANHQYVWLTENLQEEFEKFLSLGSKEQKASNQQATNVIFKIFSNGNDSGRDAWVYNFKKEELLRNVKVFSETYNSEVSRFLRISNSAGKALNIDNFVLYDDKKIKWTRNAKRDLSNGKYANFSTQQIVVSLYRPFQKVYHYKGKIYNKEVALFPKIFPNDSSEKENQAICVSAVGNNKPFHCLIVNIHPDLHLTGDSQCFPFYIYSEDGKHREENITGWALIHFCKHYQDTSITKWDIFYYVYGILHNEEYRQKYAANLKRELPRVPYAPDLQTFRSYSQAGKQLAELHVNYEQQPEYPLTRVYTLGKPHNWEVQKMKLNKEKTEIIYNEWLKLGNIPPQTFEYRLGNRSALEWIIDQYQVKTDARSGIVNDPNQYDSPQYIVKLIGQVIHVSLETVKIVKALPPLFT